MKTLLILVMLGLSALASAQQALPWPAGQTCGRMFSLTYDNQFKDAYTKYEWYGYVFRENEVLMAQLMGYEKVKMSMEWLQFREGMRVMEQTEYAPDCDDFPSRTEDKAVQDLLAKQEAGTLTKADFKGPRWIHPVQAIDTEEVNCLAMSKINGVLGGCGDVWQDGITEDEAVCFKGQQYLKCHVGCIEKIYNRKVEVTPGFCPEAE